jgi:hypothetical protein
MYGIMDALTKLVAQQSFNCVVFDNPPLMVETMLAFGKAKASFYVCI